MVLECTFVNRSGHPASSTTVFFAEISVVFQKQVLKNKCRNVGPTLLVHTSNGSSQHADRLQPLLPPVFLPLTDSSAPFFYYVSGTDKQTSLKTLFQSCKCQKQ